jgi:hypothetical protein
MFRVDGSALYNLINERPTSLLIVDGREPDVFAAGVCAARVVSNAFSAELIPSACDAGHLKHSFNVKMVADGKSIRELSGRNGLLFPPALHGTSQRTKQRR